MSNSLVYKIASNAIVAAFYFVLTIICSPISFLNIQVRLAEALLLLCFFRKDYWIGVTLGCLLSNFTSPMGYWDWIIGTGATLVSSLLIAYASPKLLIGVFYPVVANAFLVGFELYYVLQMPFWLSVLEVGVGELIAVSLGYLFFMLMKKRKGFFEAIGTNTHRDFVF